MELTFGDDAGETFRTIIDQFRNAACTVRITTNLDDDTYPDDGPRHFDATLLGSADDSEWYDAVQYRDFDEETGGPTGDVKTVRTARIHIY